MRAPGEGLAFEYCRQGHGESFTEAKRAYPLAPTSGQERQDELYQGSLPIPEYNPPERVRTDTLRLGRWRLVEGESRQHCGREAARQ